MNKSYMYANAQYRYDQELVSYHVSLEAQKMCFQVAVIYHMTVFIMQTWPFST